MAAVSKYSDPRDYVYWNLENGKIALYTQDVDSIDEVLNSIDESVTNGLLVRCKKEPVALDPEAADITAEELPINTRLHSAILDYVLHRLYLERAEVSQETMYASREHYRLFARKVARLPNLLKAEDGIRIIPQRVLSLRR
ncbi:hypothetical protein ACFL4H_00040 [Candidatus Neomarinimicrobiota bacterium]